MSPLRIMASKQLIDMRIHKLFLEQHPDSKFIGMYSRFKLGEVESVDHFADKVVKIIKQNIIEENNKYALYVGVKSPKNIFCTSSSFLLSKRVAKTLGLELYVGQYKYRYNKKNFYDNSSDRHLLVQKPTLKNKNKILKKSQKIIIIDDSYVSGNTLKVTVDELSGFTIDIYCVCILDLSSLKILEKEANNFAYETGGIKLLSEISNQKNYIYTSQMIRTLSDLNNLENKTYNKNLKIYNRLRVHLANKYYFS